MPGGDMMQTMMAGLANAQSGGADSGDLGGDDMPDLANLMATMLNGGGMKKGQRVDTNAINRQVKRKNTITEMKKRAEIRRTQQAALVAQQVQEQQHPTTPLLTDDEIIAMMEENNEPSKSKTSGNSSSKKKKSKNKK